MREAQRRDEHERIRRKKSSLHNLVRRFTDRAIVARVLIAVGKGIRVGHEVILEHRAARAEGLFGKAAIDVVEECLILPAPAHAVRRLQPPHATEARFHCSCIFEVVACAEGRDGLGKATHRNHAVAIIVDEGGVLDDQSQPCRLLQTHADRGRPARRSTLDREVGHPSVRARRAGQRVPYKERADELVGAPGPTELRHRVKADNDAISSGALDATHVVISHNRINDVHSGDRAECDAVLAVAPRVLPLEASGREGVVGTYRVARARLHRIEARHSLAVMRRAASEDA